MRSGGTAGGVTRDTGSTGNRLSQQPITLPSTTPSEGSNINQPKLTAAQSHNVIKNDNLPLTYTHFPDAPERKLPLGTRIHPRLSSTTKRHKDHQSMALRDWTVREN